MNEAESSEKYENYVRSHWDTFDCVVVVMDGIQGVNNEEQVALLKFVKESNEKLKDIPTIILGNKMDDLEDEDNISLIEETRSKAIEIFGTVAEGIDEIIASEGAIRTAFIPLSAKNAFVYRKVGTIDLDQLRDPRHQDLVDKIGSDEYGRKWSKMNRADKIKAVSEILESPSELDERVASTNFHTFLAVLSKFVGGDSTQQDILVKQIDIITKRISLGNLGSKTISELVYEVFNLSKSIGRTDTKKLKETFWNVFDESVDVAFIIIECIQERVDPSCMMHLFTELEKYHEMASKLKWTEESLLATKAMKKLLGDELLFLLGKLKAWNFGLFLERRGGEISESEERRFCSNKHYCAEHEYSDAPCRKIYKSSIGKKEYCVCGNHDTISWEKGWIIPEKITWSDLSPEDWIAILNSLSLLWNRPQFAEDFGREKIELNTALIDFQTVFRSRFGMNFEPVGHEDRLLITAYNMEMEKDEDEFKLKSKLSRVKMPDSLDDPSHWGYLSSKYINFLEKQKHRESNKRKFPEI